MGKQCKTTGLWDNMLVHAVESSSQRHLVAITPIKKQSFMLTSVNNGYSVVVVLLSINQ